MNFAIPCPDAGELAILTFDIADLEKLEERYGEDYVQEIFKGLDALRTPMVKACLEIGLKGGDLASLLQKKPVDQLATLVADAIYLRLHGRKISEREGRGKSQSGSGSLTGRHSFP